MVLTTTISSWWMIPAFVCWGARYTHAFCVQQQQQPSVVVGGALRANEEASGDHIQMSPFINSSWILRLDFGLEPGSFMPQRFPEWAASGARLGVPVELLFTDTPAVAASTTASIPETLFGSNDNNRLPLYQVKVSPTLNSTFVSERGEEQVTFAGGGYSMERSSIVLLDDDDDAPTPKPRFLLRFWIDCINGSTRKDVELKPSTCIVGTIPIWDDPDQIAQLEQELESTKAMIRQAKQKELKQDSDATGKKGARSSSLLGLLFGTKKDNDEDDETSLEYRQEQLERLLPIKGCSVAADNGVITAPKGSLVMSDDSESTKKQKYLIIGRFSMKCSD